MASKMSRQEEQRVWESLMSEKPTDFRQVIQLPMKQFIVQKMIGGRLERALLQRRHQRMIGVHANGQLLVAKILSDDHVCKLKWSRKAQDIQQMFALRKSVAGKAWVQLTLEFYPNSGQTFTDCFLFEERQAEDFTLELGKHRMHGRMHSRRPPNSPTPTSPSTSAPPPLPPSSASHSPPDRSAPLPSPPSYNRDAPPLNPLFAEPPPPLPLSQLPQEGPLISTLFPVDAGSAHPAAPKEASEDTVQEQHCSVIQGAGNPALRAKLQARLSARQAQASQIKISPPVAPASSSFSSTTLSPPAREPHAIAIATPVLAAPGLLDKMPSFLSPTNRTSLPSASAAPPSQDSNLQNPPHRNDPECFSTSSSSFPTPSPHPPSPAPIQLSHPVQAAGTNPFDSVESAFFSQLTPSDPAGESSGWTDSTPLPVASTPAASDLIDLLFPAEQSQGPFHQTPAVPDQVPMNAALACHSSSGAPSPSQQSAGTSAFSSMNPLATPPTMHSSLNHHGYVQHQHPQSTGTHLQTTMPHQQQVSQPLMQPAMEVHSRAQATGVVLVEGRVTGPQGFQSQGTRVEATPITDPNPALMPSGGELADWFDSLTVASTPSAISSVPLNPVSASQGGVATAGKSVTQGVSLLNPFNDLGVVKV